MLTCQEMHMPIVLFVILLIAKTIGGYEMFISVA